MSEGQKIIKVAKSDPIHPESTQTSIKKGPHNTSIGRGIFLVDIC